MAESKKLKRNSDGDFAPEYEDEEFVKAVKKHEPASTSEVANEVGCTSSNALYRLKELRRKELINGKIVSNWTWWVENHTPEATAD